MYKHLRHGKKSYEPKQKPSAGCKYIPNRTDLRERPSIVDRKGRLGDWEVDLMCGPRGKGYILTMVERKSKFVRIMKLKRKKASDVASAIHSCLSRCPNSIVHTITCDNGKEFWKHEWITRKWNAKVYFATPYRSCESGLIEHINGLLRQFFPKKCNLLLVTEEEIRHAKNRLNARPRKMLGFKTPQEVYNALAAQVMHSSIATIS